MIRIKIRGWNSHPYLGIQWILGRDGPGGAGIQEIQDEFLADAWQSPHEHLGTKKGSEDAEPSEKKPGVPIAYGIEA